MRHVELIHVRQEIADEIRKRLGSDYDIVLERTHLHIEFQPKEALC